MNDLSARLNRFVQHVESRFDRDRPDSFTDCEPMFRDLLVPNLAAEALHLVLGGMQDHPYRRGDWTYNQLVLRRGPGYALSICLLDQPSRYLHTAPFLAMVSPLQGMTLSYDSFRLPASYHNAVFDPALQLERAGSGTVPPRDILYVHPDGPIHDIHFERPQLVLRFSSSAWHVLEWLFDRNSLRAVQANDAALSTTQLRVASYLLGRLGHASSVEPLKRLSNSSIPNLRWAAIQNLGRLDAVEALSQLEKAVNDPHPHIRRAAQRSLATFSNSDRA